MLDLHREKTGTSTQEQSRRFQEPPPKTWANLEATQGRAPLLGGAAARGSPPIGANLADAASTDFED